MRLSYWTNREAIHSAAERLWVRLREPARIEPEKNFAAWEEIQVSLAARTMLNLRQLEVSSGLAPAAQDHHIPTTPALTFKGNMPVAVAEARNLIETGHRVAFFAKSTGELERLGDVLQEYSVPYQLGIESAGGSRGLTERAYFAGAVASTYLIKGDVRRGATLPESHLAILGFEDLFQSSDLIARQPSRSQLAAFAADIADLKPGDFVVHATHGVGRFVGHPRNCARRPEGRLHVARIRGRGQAVCAAHAHGPGPEIPRRG